jgi:5-(carboxyamino)imidazole ribonucleotide synthase
MLAMAAARLGLRTHILSDETGPAFDVAQQTTLASFDDLDAIRAFARQVDIITYEFENVPLAAAAAANEVTPVRPGPRALEIAQDRLAEKTFAKSLGLETPPFYAISSPSDFDAAAAETGLPAILKTRRLGYDGKGQARIARAGELEAGFESLGRQACVLEGFVRFDYEISVLVVRDVAGNVAFYDIPLNTHEAGILRRSVVPAPITPGERQRAEAAARKFADALDYVGLLAVEMFVVPNGADKHVLINEIAPRVHNSGHWTIEACAASQFENHIRAVAGWPLASTARHADAEMVNLIGTEAHDWQRLAAECGTALHLYGKNEARPGRKMGHVTRLHPLTTR